MSFHGSCDNSINMGLIMKKFTSFEAYRLAVGKLSANIVVKKWFSNSVTCLKISRRPIVLQASQWTTKHRESPEFDDFYTLNKTLERFYSHLNANECIREFRVYSAKDGIRFVTVFDDKVVTVSKFEHGKAVSYKMWFDTCIEDIAVHWPDYKLELLDKDTLSGCQEVDVNVAGIYLNLFFNKILR